MVQNDDQPGHGGWNANRCDWRADKLVGSELLCDGSGLPPQLPCKSRSELLPNRPDVANPPSMSDWDSRQPVSQTVTDELATVRPEPVNERIGPEVTK
jgi:hypothetical protein